MRWPSSIVLCHMIWRIAGAGNCAPAAALLYTAAGIDKEICMSDFTPQPEHKFTLGLWTVGNIGRDPFRHPARQPLAPPELVPLLAETRARGVNLHDHHPVTIAP